MNEDYNNLPAAIRADIETLADDLIARPVADKRTLSHCFKNGDEPPEHLAAALDAIREAVKHPGAEDRIFTALEAPQTRISDPEDREDQISPQEAAELAKNFTGLFQLMQNESKDRIAAAIKDPKKIKAFNVAERYLWGMLGTILCTTTEQRERISRIFNVTREALDKLAADLKDKRIEIPLEDIDGYLPGLEPQQKRNRYPAPPYIYPKYTTIPTAELARRLPNLPFQNTEAGALAEIGIDRRPHEHHVYMLMLDKLSEQYPITAGDKNILIALGNLYGERKDAGNIGLQNGSIITAADIIRRYRGYQAEDSIDQASIDAVTERMDFLSKLRVSFDFTQHFEYRKKDIGTGEEVELAIPDDMRRIDDKTGTVIRFSYIGNMVHSNTIEVEYSSGRIERAWEILTPPIVFDYAQKIKQVATIETRLLDLRKRAKKSGYNSTGADIMKIYLIERINAMIDVKTHQPKNTYSQAINLDTMFEDLRIEIANRKTKKIKIDMARDILDHFKTMPDKHRGQFIKDYRIVKGYRGAVTGFEILF